MKFLKILPWLSVLVLIVSQTSCTGDLDEDYVNQRLEEWKNWDFDLFDLYAFVGDEIIHVLLNHILEKHDLYDTFQISRESLTNFLNGLVLGSHRYNASYHNYLHAIDVLHSVDFIISIPGIKKFYSPLEKLAMLFAALTHDNEHMGLTNDFHIKAQTERAIIYNDQCINENYHLYATFRLLRQDDCNFLTNLKSEDYRKFRSLVIRLVMYTDWAMHSELLSAIEDLNDNEDKKERRFLPMAFILHCSDISNSANFWGFHFYWASQLVEELTEQAKQEELLGLDKCDLCDESKSVPEIFEEAFYEIVKPTFSALYNLLEYLVGENGDIPNPWNDHIKVNLARWISLT